MASTVPETTSAKDRSMAVILNRIVYAFSRRWFVLIMILMGFWVGLPWLAPIFMRFGWEKSAKAIYFLYSFQCHQLPQRSFFLFGQQEMYSLKQIQATWKNTYDLVILRQFIGTVEMGYKVAWSDRMVSAYTSIPLFALLWWSFRRRLRALTLWGLLLFAIPMVIDGGSHFISDMTGIGQGFRYTNAWLAFLTNNSLPVSFYVGNGLGSFNSWMRLITGILFGVGLVWFSFPLIDDAFHDIARAIEAKFTRADAIR